MGNSSADDAEHPLKSPRLQVYGTRPRSDKQGFDLISEALPLGQLGYGQAEEARQSMRTNQN
jgi:hypothetical protein